MKNLLVGWSYLTGDKHYEVLVKGNKYMWKWTLGFGIIDLRYDPVFVDDEEKNNLYEVTKFLK